MKSNEQHASRQSSTRHAEFDYDQGGAGEWHSMTFNNNNSSRRRRSSNSNNNNNGSNNYNGNNNNNNSTSSRSSTGTTTATTATMHYEFEATHAVPKEPIHRELRLRIARLLDSSESGNNSYLLCFDNILTNNARHVAQHAGIDYNSLGIIERLLLIRFRCQTCGVLPFYFLDLRHVNRMRCGKCSSLVGLKNSGKYGRMRKMIAIRACREIDAALDSDLHLS